jgi:ketosteroid isomerase-like protein
MASANLDLVRSIFAAWERGDFSSVEWADPDIEFVIADGPDPGRWTGLTGMRDAFLDRVSVLAGFRPAADEYRELDNQTVLVLLHAVAGRGRTSELEVVTLAELGANLFRIDNGKATRLVVYLDGQRALVDLLREDYEAWARDS